MEGVIESVPSIQNSENQMIFDISDKIQVTYLPSSDIIINSSCEFDITSMINEEILSIYDEFQEIDIKHECENEPVKHSEINSKNFECPVCSKTFVLKQNLIAHQKLHAGLKPFVCQVCGQKFSKKATLISHQRIHSGVRPYLCQTCGRRFSQKSTMVAHEKTHTGMKPYYCKVCNKQFLRKTGLVIHERIHTGTKPYECNWCNRTFITSGNLRVHERIHLGVKPFACAQCEKQFSTTTHMKRHMIKAHSSNDIKCEHCDKRFRSDEDLIVHINKIHLKIRQEYPCQWCIKSFKSLSELTMHKRCHYGEKAFTCEICGNKFSTSSSLYIHQKIHTNEKSFKCLQCGKAFLRKAVLGMHEKTHSSDKPFSCKVCGKKFGRRETLLYHEKTHLGLKPHQCLRCGKLLCTRSYLVKHEEKCSGKYIEPKSIDDQQIDVNKKLSSGNRRKSLQCQKCGIYSKNMNGLSYHEKHGCTTQNLQNFAETVIDTIDETLASVTTVSGECLILVDEAYATDLGANQIILDLSDQNVTFRTADGMEETKVINVQAEFVSPRRNKRPTGEAHALSCPHCGKLFTAPSRLEVHSRIHTGVKPYTCNICKKCFNQKVHLENHVVKKHDGQKVRVRQQKNPRRKRTSQLEQDNIYLSEDTKLAEETFIIMECTTEDYQPTDQ